MHYLIDGHNLIARLEDMSLDDPDDEAKLVLRLRSWTAASKKRRVTVIFDGGLPGGKSTRLSTGPVSVLFASSGQTADDLLIRRINQIKNPAEFTLISSDHEVIAAARKRRMPITLSEEFATQLPTMRPHKSPSSPPTEVDSNKAAADGRETPHLTEDELNEWLDLFGPVPERKPAPSPTPPQPTTDKPTSDPLPAKRGIGRVDRERKLSVDEVEEWLRLFGQPPE